MTFTDIPNTAAENVSYYTPAQIPPAGQAIQGDDIIPTLFQPIKIRGVQFHNRIFLSPLCQYSAVNGSVTHWHLAHLGGIISRGPGLSFVEATSVTPEGRITPEDTGIWSDNHVEGLRQIAEFAHSQNQKIGIQLGHAGRKASTVAPWLGRHAVATNAVGGWVENVVAPSPIALNDNLVTPQELSIAGIQDIIKAFVEGAKRAVKAGFDVIEIHNAHGYLLHQFVSPYSNKRTDNYGGSFENRIRFTLEIVDAVRAVIPETMPLFLRISASDLLEDSLPNEPSWRVEDTIRFAHILAKHGIDFIDVSAAGNAVEQSFKGFNLEEPGYQASFAEAVKKSVGDKLIVGTVGGINSGKAAQKILDDGKADVVLCGRWFQKNPTLVWQFAEELGVNVNLARQMDWPFFGRGKRATSA